MGEPILPDVIETLFTLSPINNRYRPVS